MGWGDGHWGEMPWGGGAPGGVELAPPAAVLSFSAVAPTLTTGSTFAPPAASVTFNAVAPSLVIGNAITIAVPAAVLRFQAVAPALEIPQEGAPMEPIHLTGSLDLQRLLGSRHGPIRKVGSP